MFQLFVEGHGEPDAAQKLVHKIIHHYGWGKAYFSEGRRLPNLHTDEGLKTAVALAKLKPGTEGVLMLRDSEDDCPKEFAPEKSKFLKSLQAPFPIAYCLLYREYETLFLAYADEWAGKEVPRIPQGVYRFAAEMEALENPESKRGAKEWLSEYLPGNQSYKPTTDQFSLTQALDIGKLESKTYPALARCAAALST